MTAVLTLTGYVGGDPEIRKTQTGEVASFTVASNRKRGNEEFTDWYRCYSFFDKTIERIETMVRRGSRVLIIGDQVQQKWEDRDGVERITCEVLISKLEMADAKPPDRANGYDSARDRSSNGRDERGGGRSAPRDGSNGRGYDDHRSGGRAADSERPRETTAPRGGSNGRGYVGSETRSSHDDRGREPQRATANGRGYDDRGSGREAARPPARGERVSETANGRDDAPRGGGTLDDDHIPFAASVL